MPRKTPDVGVEPFEVRPGLGFKYFRGMNRSADPGRIPLNQFHLLSNVRLTPSDMVDRPGVVSDHVSGDACCITGMIEVNETGIGFWYTPAEKTRDDSIGGAIDQKLLGNLNEQRTPLVIRYNDQETAVREPPRVPDNPAGTLPVNPDGFANASSTSSQIEKTTEYNANIDGGWSSLFKYRQRLMQIGSRERQKQDDESATETVVCIWEVKLPEEDEPPVEGVAQVANYELYQDLWVTESDIEINHVVSVFGRNDDQLSGDERINEVLFIARRDGKVYSFDGTTLRLEVDFGTDTRLRLGVFNEMGIFAIGSEFPDGAGGASAKFLSEVGGTWVAVTLPETEMLVTDLIPWNGSIYISAKPNATTGNTEPRIYRYTGTTTLAAFIEELPVGYVAAGHFFSYRGALYVTGKEVVGPADVWHFFQRVSDGTWTELPNNVMFNQDFDAAVHWILVTAQRVIVGGLYTPDGPNFGQPVSFSEEKEMIVEYTDFSTSSGPSGTLLYVNTDDDQQEQTGRTALVVAPEDTVLNDEEL